MAFGLESVLCGQAKSPGRLGPVAAVDRLGEEHPCSLREIGVTRRFRDQVGELPHDGQLFLSVEGSFDIKFEFVHERPFATILLLASGAYLIFVVSRRILSE